MNCQHCGMNAAANTLFCVNCGSRLNLSSSARTITVSPEQMNNQTSNQERNYINVSPNQNIGFSNSKKSLGLAAALSFFLCGMGHVYLGQSTKGFTLLAVSVLFLITGILAPVAVIIFITQIIDAYVIGKRLSAGRTVRDWEFFFN